MRGKEKTEAFAAIITFMAMVLFMPLAAMGGDLEPPAGPDSPDSAMYTIEDIYNYLDTGVAGTKRTGGFTEPAAEPGSTGHTLDEIHEKVGQRCITCEGTLSALGRWCDQGDGTVKDMTTGLVWLQDANCMGMMNWYSAIEQPITNLKNGDCSGTLTDGSVWGDWRLPTKNELYRLANGTESVRSGSPRFFTGVQLYYYWSSTGHADYPDSAWWVSMIGGGTTNASKSGDFYVLPVRSDN